jgi:ribosomal protein L11 methyltransferase
MTEEGWHGVEITMAPDCAPDSNALDVLSSLLFELGAGGLETKDERRPVQVIAAFPPSVDHWTLVDQVKSALADHQIGTTSVELKTYEPVDWANHWRQHFHPIGFGPLWVVPTWLEPPPSAQKVLRIDPSMAFGTGLHATTALCIERIIELSVPGEVLDVGTGTGILALAALAMGAERAVATDNDPDALTVAAENAELNGWTSSVELSGKDVARIGGTYPLVVANILAGPLVELAPALSRRVAPGGRLILSGILGTQAEEVVKAYEAEGLIDATVTPRDEWVRIDFSAKEE